ncbi:glycosyl transferase family 2 [Breoghania corrubedonensis]|uniref:Glycosyl transferase family 2 n=1 Tax=Breoghania corrubedonensis TaxID=665038 RepID=A0A2T5VEH1_9HYPH|nr:glycosyltransferase family A protein [Breoghania corrubedonensis]PTW62116.1 glycosyl transferase family 2 [Breoghania corrubedonensis]
MLSGARPAGETRAKTLFTILLPIVRPPTLLPYAIESVITQTEADFELCIVCDGAPAETVACAERYAAADPRVRVFAFEKGARYGEAHRAAVLEGSSALFVAQLGDDDLWFPEYLAEAARMLEVADFGNLLQVELTTDGGLHVLAGDLSDTDTRERMINSKWNFFGPPVASYRLSAYRALPEGWTPAPVDVWSDLHMWRKFLMAADLVFATRFSIQCLKVAANVRGHMSLDERCAETRRMAGRIASEDGRAALRAAAMRTWFERSRRMLADEQAKYERMNAAYDALKATRDVLRDQRDDLRAQRDSWRRRLDLVTGRTLAREVASLFRKPGSASATEVGDGGVVSGEAGDEVDEKGGA